MASLTSTNQVPTPLTGSGKIQKFALRDKWQTGDYSS